MSVYCMICDDDDRMINITKDILKKAASATNTAINISSYTDSRNLLFDLYEDKPVNMAFLDIEMPYYDGMQLAREIKKHSPECVIIFITSYTSYSVDAHELQIFRYIPKLKIEERLYFAIVDGLKIIDSQKLKSYIVKKGRYIERIPYKNIIYITKQGKNSVLTCINGGDINVRKSLADIECELDKEEFIAIDRGCIANITHILKIVGSDVVMTNGDYMVVSRSKFNGVKNHLLKYWEDRI